MFSRSRNSSRRRRRVGKAFLVPSSLGGGEEMEEEEEEERVGRGTGWGGNLFKGGTASWGRGWGFLNGGAASLGEEEE